MSSIQVQLAKYIPVMILNSTSLNNNKIPSLFVNPIKCQSKQFT